MENSADNSLVILVAAGTGGMLLLSGAIVLFVAFYQKRIVQEKLKQQLLASEFQQKMLEATLDSQENERSRVASDLHDSIGGMLSAVRIGLSSIVRHLPNPHLLDEQKQMLDETIDAVRKMSRDLMPATLEKFGLIPAMREFCDRMQSTTRIQIGFMELGEARPVEKRRQLMIYRIAQELMNNAFKHSKATYIEVVFNFGEQLQMVVEDNGVGIDREKLEESGRKSLGLFNIQSRVQLLSATVTIDPDKKDGTKIIVVIPYE